ncbi:hypothetical protein [Leucobacter salsicius]|uniref:hypothetical protein n=1 Tax=Leucobacter salsicius TaxID=664638 RepID=UPI00034914E9|nr:hypothetical protein [Leucobacter salsicius]
MATLLTPATITTVRGMVSLAEAAHLTGSSLGRFRYNRPRLQELGATITEKSWAIPLAALVKMEWLTPAQAAEVKPSPLDLAQDRIAELEAQLASTREELAAVQAEAGARRTLFGRRR